MRSCNFFAGEAKPKPPMTQRIYRPYCSIKKQGFQDFFVNFQNFFAAAKKICLATISCGPSPSATQKRGAPLPPLQAFVLQTQVPPPPCRFAEQGKHCPFRLASSAPPSKVFVEYSMGEGTAQGGALPLPPLRGTSPIPLRGTGEAIPHCGLFQALDPMPYGAQGRLLVREGSPV